MNTWERDTLTNEHYLPVSDDLSWKVYKTAAGDYALTLHSEETRTSDEVDFFDTLAQAKREAEKRKATA